MDGNTLKQEIFGTLASLQTILERYPVLYEGNLDTGETSISFMLSILRMFHVTSDEIMEWLSNLLSDKEDGTNGVLSIIEEGIKAAILVSFKNTYTCSIDPMLPDDTMHSIYYETEGEMYPIRGEGIKVKISDIDTFGLLSNCPTDKNGSLFYFDNIDKYTPLNIWSSTDFNAYLWYCINRGTSITLSEKKKCVWDNRRLYRQTFKKNGCLNGEAATDLATKKGQYFAYDCLNQSNGLSPIGPKKELLWCKFGEDGIADADNITVYLNPDRYYHLNGNKTIFQFNTDYLASLKLFDTKTLVAQIVNAVLGITASSSISFSIKRNAVSKQVKEIVKQVMKDASNETSIDDCYYNFDNYQYTELLEEAERNYQGYSDNGEVFNKERVYDELYRMESTDNLEREPTIIKNVFTAIAEEVSKEPENAAPENKYSLEFDILNRFIEETATEIILQVLSPKIMLLYAINDRVMNPNGNNRSVTITDFFKNFKNLMVDIIKKIFFIIVGELYEFLISMIKPIIELFINKLLLETYYYYEILIRQLIETCTAAFNGGQSLEVADVVGADIIPQQIAPQKENTCRS